MGDFTMVLLGSGTGRKRVASERRNIRWKAGPDPTLFVNAESCETGTAMDRRLESRNRRGNYRRASRRMARTP